MYIITGVSTSTSYEVEADKTRKGVVAASLYNSKARSQYNNAAVYTTASVQNSKKQKITSYCKIIVVVIDLLHNVLLILRHKT